VGYKREIRSTCAECGKEIISKGHKKYCEDCLKQRNKLSRKKYEDRMKAEGNFVPTHIRYRYECKHCGAKTNNSVCSLCKKKWELCGIIVEMLDREKKRYGYYDR
jgi:hypothetical protein